MPYVDGFLLPVSKKNLPAYKKLSQKAGKIWLEHGALEYRECVGEDLKNKWGAPFTKAAGTKGGETVVFSWIVYKDKKQRDAVNKKVMADPRLKSMMDPKNHPFDVKRMCYGGFEVMVDLVR